MDNISAVLEPILSDGSERNISTIREDTTAIFIQQQKDAINSNASGMKELLINEY